MVETSLGIKSKEKVTKGEKYKKGTVAVCATYCLREVSYLVFKVWKLDQRGTLIWSSFIILLVKTILKSQIPWIKSHLFIRYSCISILCFFFSTLYNLQTWCLGYDLISTKSLYLRFFYSCSLGDWLEFNYYELHIKFGRK